MALFVDTVDIVCRAGSGGDGCVSFHREKFVANGGPDGGDGGRGGSIVFEADNGMNTLLDFRYTRKYQAEDGKRGEENQRSGLSGADMTIRVPVGTLVKDTQSGHVLADLKEHGQRCVVLRGGRGGAGNTHFKNSVRQAPTFAKPGIKPEPRTLTLELKSIADVGLVGFPNAGKSTLLSVMTSARPKIAGYPFTTLTPNLGVVRMEGGDGFVMADIPGIIEGAHEGAGLGHDFLRHVERTRLLVHVVDMAGVDGRDPVEDYDAINHELAQYGRLSERPQVIAANKMDVDGAQDNLERLIEHVGEAVKVYPVSGATTHGIDALRRAVARALVDAPPVEIIEDEPIAAPSDAPPFTVRRHNASYVVEGPLAVSMMERVNINDDASLAFLDRTLRRMGVIDALRAAGAKDGDTVDFGGLEFDFID